MRWVARSPTAPSSREWNGSQSGQGATELGFPGPALGKMQGEAAGRAGDSSGEGEEPPPEGLGGHHLLTQTGPRCPTGQVMRHHLYRQPGGVGGESAEQFSLALGDTKNSQWGLGGAGRFSSEGHKWG